MNDSSNRKQAISVVNAARALNGLEAIQGEFLDVFFDGTHVPIGYRYQRDGWVITIYNWGEMKVFPPEPFPVEFPRCPLTGDLFDQKGPVKGSCDHDWQELPGTTIRQCLKCRQGEALNVDW